MVPETRRNEASASQSAPAENAPDEEPQPSRPREKRALMERFKSFLFPRHGTATLRENLQNELARDGEGDTVFSTEERMLLGNILRLRELRVDDVMIPRADIESVEAGTTLGRLMELFQESGHSRMPVYVETLDDPRGMVHIKDLMVFIAENGSRTGRPEADGSTAVPDDSDLTKSGGNSQELDLGVVDLSISLKDVGLIRQLLFVPPSMPATDLMAKMQADRIQMALVIDEYGGTDGLISLEDLVETVVGDIEDEHDEDEEAMLQLVSDGIWTADPRLPLEELTAGLGADLSGSEASEDVDTLGGLLYVSVGRVPVRGELLLVPDVPGFEFEVMDADPRRIKRLRIRRKRLDARIADQRRRVKRPESAQSTDESHAEQ
ncbi:HlyC/CorC family transporter [Roseibium sp. CAU 1637]|uniref:HlyC/CorC family transporter n=2 Tax=Stappiaceae TaxID=2821832 RepID=A0A939ER32_9HYPH|nr:HlyC/CorC family transporter [Roseibium limicola]